MALYKYRIYIDHRKHHPHVIKRKRILSWKLLNLFMRWNKFDESYATEDECLEKIKKFIDADLKNHNKKEYSTNA